LDSPETGERWARPWYWWRMASPGKTFRTFIKTIARAQRTFSIEIGPIRATGVPAVLVGVTGIIVGSGIASMLVRGAARLPETLGEARMLAEALRSDRTRLNP
jgi:hypothetical protein